MAEQKDDRPGPGVCSLWKPENQKPAGIVTPGIVEKIPNLLLF